MYVSNNLDGAMRSIMYVLDDFAGFGQCNTNIKFWTRNGPNHLDHFSYFSRVFSKMDLKIEKFDFLHGVYFRNPEIERFRPLSKFFRSEVI